MLFIYSIFFFFVTKKKKKKIYVPEFIKLVCYLKNISTENYTGK